MSRIKFCLRTGFFLAAVVMILISMAIAKSEGTQPEKEAKNEQILNLRVISRATGEPISDAKLSIIIMQERREDKADKDGQCRIVLGEKTPEYVRVEVRKEGFVPIRLSWRQTVSHPSMPDQYTLTLEQGTSIGGIIHDEQGEPIEGASVYLLVPGGDEIERVAIWDHVEKTDAEGRWRCDIIPSKLDDIWIRLAHPDYISDEMYGKTPKPPIEQLRTMTGVMVMKQGLTVSGRVIDANDRPIEGASVAQGSDRFGSHYPSTQTDSEGRFEFKNARPDEMVLTVQAKGYSPDLKSFTVYKGMESIEFCLEPGHTIRGRIIDTAGNPVSGAFVAADTWRGHRSLQWRVDTDAEGRFEWNEAPPDEVLIDMGKQHYMSVRNYVMSPSEKEYEITMPPELKISGKVVDAETGELISEFKLLTGIDWGGDRPISWQRRSTKTFTQGQYEIGFSYPYPAHLIRIEAEGYKPGISRPIGSDEGQVTSDFELEKGMGPTGIVHLPDGRPASWAEVILCTPSQGAYIRNGRNQQKRDSQYVETKEDGKFSFPVQADVYAIVVLHEEGYLEVGESELDESSELTLQSWATVTGKVLIGKNPGANETVRLGFDRPYDRNQPRIYHDYQAVTDSNGNFVLEHVPPGKARISRSIRISDRISTYSHSMSIDVKAGETVNVTIGGTGRPVTGKVQIPDYLKEKFDWQNTDYGLRVDSSNGQYRQFGFKVEGDGTFRIDDIPAGDYYLYVNAYEPAADPRAFRGKRIGSLSRHFNIPEMPGGRSDEPLDLGVLELGVFGTSDYAPSLVGKPLTDMNGITTDFTPAQAQDRMVLVCFFDMNQRPSRHCLTQLTEQAEQLKSKDVAVVAVQATKINQEALNQWVKKYNVPFLVGMVQGDAEKTRFNWGVKSLPWLILTDREHVVCSEGFGLDELDWKLSETAGVASGNSQLDPKQDSSVSASPSDHPLEKLKKPSQSKKSRPAASAPANRLIRVVGVVRDQNGQPVAGADVRRLHGPETSTDSSGKFELAWDPARHRPLVDTYYLIARHEQKNLSIVVEVPEFEHGTETVSPKLLPGVIIRGKVVDPTGKGIEPAHVSILLHTPSQGSGLYSTITDSEGMFEFRGIPTNHKYSFAAQASGYGNTWVHNIYAGHDLARKSFQLEPIILAIADQSVSGVVVDANDKPVSGAQLMTDGQGQPQHYNVRTDAEGRFTIEEVCTGDLRIYATVRSETLLGYARTHGGATDVRIVLKEVPSPDRRRYLPKMPPSLIGRAVPELKDIGLERFSAEAGGKEILLCFFDLDQRPSRYFISQIAQRAEQIKNHGLVLVVIQVSKVDEDKLNGWTKKNNVPFAIGMAKGDATKTRFTYGVKSLPWLILTDKEHIVRAEGFALDELEEKVRENRNVQE